MAIVETSYGLVGLGWQGTSPPSPLCTLPPEQIGQIFKEVRLLHKNKQMVGAICHKLLPYTRANLYRDIAISSLSSFDLLRRTVASGGPPLACLITSFDLDVNPDPAEIRDERPKDLPPGFVYLGYDTPDYFAFFASLTNVEKIRMSGTSCSAHCLLLSEFPATNLQKLKVLDLGQFSHAFEDPFNPLIWNSLGRFPSLEVATLDIRLYDTRQRCLSGCERFFNEESPISNVRELSITGDLKGDEEWTPLKHLLAQFTKLDVLILNDEQGVSFSEALSTVSPSITSLEISRYEEVEEVWETDAVDEALLIFTHLESLELGSDCYTSIVFTQMAQLNNLNHLTLHHGDALNFRTLYPFLSTLGSDREILRLELQVDKGATGPEGSWDSEGELRKKGWRAPAWPSNLSYAEALAIAQLAKDGQRFILEGTILVAFKTQEAYDDQLIIVERAPFDALVRMENKLLEEELARLRRIEVEKQKIVADMKKKVLGLRAAGRALQGSCQSCVEKLIECSHGH